MHLYLWRKGEIMHMLGMASFARLGERRCIKLRGQSCWETYLEAAQGAIEKRGPVTGEIFTKEYLRLYIDRECENCKTRLPVSSSSLMKSMKNRVDSLQDSI